MSAFKLSDLQDAVNQVTDGVVDLRRRFADVEAERDQLKAELAKLQAERNEIDNGDGTVTAMLPVTHPKGLDVIEVRTRRRGDLYATCVGKPNESESDESAGAPGCVWLILRPAPKPPEPVTWEAPFVDGEVLAHERCVEVDGWGNTWEVARKLFGVKHPAKLGTYQFKDGVGTLIQEAGNV